MGTMFTQMFTMANTSTEDEEFHEARESDNMCDVCGEGVIVMVCAECENERLCKRCSDIHRKQKATMKHVLAPMVTVAENQQTCSKHHGEVISQVCRGCDIVICTTCKSEDHVTHSTCTIDASEDVLLKICQNAAGNLTTSLNKLNYVRLSMDSQSSMVDKIYLSTRADINKRRELLTKQYQNMIAQSELSLKQADDNYKVNKQTIKTHCDVIQNNVTSAISLLEETTISVHKRDAQKLFLAACNYTKKEHLFGSTHEFDLDGLNVDILFDESPSVNIIDAETHFKLKTVDPKNVSTDDVKYSNTDVNSALNEGVGNIDIEEKDTAHVLENHRNTDGIDTKIDEEGETPGNKDDDVTGRNDDDVADQINTEATIESNHNSTVKSDHFVDNDQFVDSRKVNDTVDDGYQTLPPQSSILLETNIDDVEDNDPVSKPVLKDGDRSSKLHETDIDSIEFSGMSYYEKYAKQIGKTDNKTTAITGNNKQGDDVEHLNQEGQTSPPAKPPRLNIYSKSEKHDKSDANKYTINSTMDQNNSVSPVHHGDIHQKQYSSLNVENGATSLGCSSIETDKRVQSPGNSGTGYSNMGFTDFGPTAVHHGVEHDLHISGAQQTLRSVQTAQAEDLGTRRQISPTQVHSFPIVYDKVSALDTVHSTHGDYHSHEYHPEHYDHTNIYENIPAQLMSQAGQHADHVLIRQNAQTPPVDCQENTDAVESHGVVMRHPKTAKEDQYTASGLSSSSAEGAGQSRTSDLASGSADLSARSEARRMDEPHSPNYIPAERPLSWTGNETEFVANNEQNTSFKRNSLRRRSSMKTNKAPKKYPAIVQTNRDKFVVEHLNNICAVSQKPATNKLLFCTTKPGMFTINIKTMVPVNHTDCAAPGLCLTLPNERFVVVYPGRKDTPLELRNTDLAIVEEVHMSAEMRFCPVAITCYDKDLFACLEFIPTVVRGNEYDRCRVSLVHCSNLRIKCQHFLAIPANTVVLPTLAATKSGNFCIATQARKDPQTHDDNGRTTHGNAKTNNGNEYVVMLFNTKGDLLSRIWTHQDLDMSKTKINLIAMDDYVLVTLGLSLHYLSVYQKKIVKVKIDEEMADLSKSVVGASNIGGRLFIHFAAFPFLESVAVNAWSILTQKNKK